MKKIMIISTVIIFICLNGFSQDAEKTSYLKKSKTQKTTAWVLLGTGAVVDIIGFATFPKGYDLFFNTSSENRQANTSTWLIVIGSATMLSSIPFTIAGHINKKKALSLGLNTQQLYQLKKSSVYTINYPALTMRIRL